MIITNKMNDAITNYKSGNKNAFSDIYTESCKYIYVCINNVVSGNDNKEDMIQDIMQDTYVEIFKHLDNLQNVDKFYSWAGTIATRKCYESIKKSNKYQLLNEDESFDNISDNDNIIPEEIMQSKEKQRLVKEIINSKLTYMQKICVINFYYNEMKQSEIARELNIPENSVKSNLLRAKAKIKEAVIELEKKEGTRLYSLTPFMVLLFTSEIEKCIIPSTISSSILQTVHSNIFGNTIATSTINAAYVNSVATDTVIKSGTKLVMSGIKKKIIIGLTSLVIGTTSVTGVVHILGKEKDETRSKIEETTKQIIHETNTEPETTTEKVEPELINISESDFEKYEQALEWLFFSERGSEYIEDSVYNFLTEELISKEIEYRKNNNIEDVYNTTIFHKYVENTDYFRNEKLTDIYIPSFINTNTKEYVTFNEMKNTLITDTSTRYALTNNNNFFSELHSWYDNSMSAEDILLYEKEMAGFRNLTVLSVDNEKRTLEIYDNTYSCKYICTFNNIGLIEKITVDADDKERYKAFYDFLVNYTTENKDDNNNNNLDDEFSDDSYYENEAYECYDDYYGDYDNPDPYVAYPIGVTIRDFDNDGIEELLTLDYLEDGYYSQANITLYKYTKNGISRVLTKAFSISEIKEITKNGFIVKQGGGILATNIIEDVSFYSINNGNLETIASMNVESVNDEYSYTSSKGNSLDSYIEAKKELLGNYRISESIRARHPFGLSDDFLKKFANTHYIFEN